MTIIIIITTDQLSTLMDSSVMLDLTLPARMENPQILIQMGVVGLPISIPCLLPNAMDFRLTTRPAKDLGIYAKQA